MYPNKTDPRSAPQPTYGYPQVAEPPQPRQAAYNGNYQPDVPPQLPQGAGHSGQWTTGLCGCLEDVSNCSLTCCCPCITFGQNAEIIDRGTVSCGFAGLVYYGLSHMMGCCCLYSFPYRAKLRALYSLPEEPCSDCCVHYCLPCCALCQEHRELKNRGLDPSIGWIANAQKMSQLGGNPAPPYIIPGMAR